MTKIGMEELMEQNVRPFGLRDKAGYMFGDFIQMSWEFPPEWSV